MIRNEHDCAAVVDAALSGAASFDGYLFGHGSLLAILGHIFVVNYHLMNVGLAVKKTGFQFGR